MVDEGEDVIFEGDSADVFEFENPRNQDGEFDLVKPAETEAGSKYVGHYTGTTDFGYGDVYVVDLMGEDRAVGFPGCAVLSGDDGEFAPIDDGDVVRVTFEGMQEPEGDGDPYANYTVEIGRRK